MSEIKPVYQWQHSNRGVLPESWWKDCTEKDFKARDNKMQFNVRIMFETTAVIESLRRDNEALQKENAELQHINLTSLADLHFKNRELESKNAALQKENAELKEINESLHSSSKFTYENQKSEIESLRKQVEELSQPIPDWKIELLFNRAIDYRELRISEAAYYKAVREILSASKNGDSK